MGAEGFARYYELSMYTPAPGKRAELLERFRRHILRLFERHGMTSIGYWLTDDEPPRLCYLLAHASRQGAAASWASFGADPEWQEVYRTSMLDGRLVVDIERTALLPTDFSPLR